MQAVFLKTGGVYLARAIGQHQTLGKVYQLGLGIGLERLVMKLLNQQNIRQASMFPRDLNRLLP